jgi:hypothetical protein
MFGISDHGQARRRPAPFTTRPELEGRARSPASQPDQRHPPGRWLHGYAELELLEAIVWNDDDLTYGSIISVYTGPDETIGTDR